jgi:hypothetical protein
MRAASGGGGFLTDSRPPSRAIGVFCRRDRGEPRGQNVAILVAGS